MKIASWNINSVRIRIHNIARLAKEQSIDILCLQEIKVRDHLFPFDEVKACGYPYIEVCGEKSYNGVAILSKFPLKNVQKYKMAGDSCRHLSAILHNEVEIHNFYFPAGGDIPDPLVNDKFANKLDYLDEVTSWLKINKKQSDKIIMLGDLNIAPLENDVWSHKQLLKEVSHTPIEIEKMNILKATLNWCDVHRINVPETDKLYSWWSYRNKDWRKSDRGRRLDHIWVTPSLTTSIKSSYIIKDARGWENPSDHVPVVVEMNI